MADLQPPEPHTPARTTALPAAYTTIKSTPVQTPPYYAEHKRQHIILPTPKKFSGTADEFVESFLKVELPDDGNVGLLPNFTFTRERFIEAANRVSQFIHDTLSTDEDIIIFKNVEHIPLPGHVVDTACKPDFVAAREKHFTAPEKDIDGKVRPPPWYHTCLVGEDGSKGKSAKEQIDQACHYLHFLTLARPDRRVVQGLFISRQKVQFLLGFGGDGVRSLELDWGSGSELHRLLHAFVYRLYLPGPFANPAITFEEATPDGKHATYTIRTRNPAEECSSFLHTYAAHPFASRTHVFSNPSSNVEIDGRPLAVIKVQLCRIDTRFEEYRILETIHADGVVPGVVEAVYHEEQEVPWPHHPAAAPKDWTHRKEHVLGLRQFGSPFLGIRTLGEMLEVAFDTLEVLKFIRKHRSALHRDISSGNVMRLAQPEDFSERRQTNGTARNIQEMCFARYLRGSAWSTKPLETSLLLIDFNHAEDLKSKNRPLGEYRTGTALYIARAVHQGKPVSLPRFYPPVLQAPSPDLYGKTHPERVEKVPEVTEIRASDLFGEIPAERVWRHELDHDAESVFWLMLHWAMRAQPKDAERTKIPLHVWGELLQSRTTLVDSLNARSPHDGTLHPEFEALGSLFSSLATFLVIDRHWITKEAPSENPEVLAEAFQRLILGFLVNPDNEPILTLEVAEEHRGSEEAPTPQSNSLTSGQMLDAEQRSHQSSGQSSGKRPHPEPTSEDRHQESREVNRRRMETRSKSGAGTDPETD